MKYHLFNYRGTLRDLVSAGTWTAFVTTHVEQQATALYRLDSSAAALSLASDPLPGGATALCLGEDQDSLWLAGSDGKLYTASLSQGKPKALKHSALGSEKVLALALLAGERLAVLQAQQLHIVVRRSGKILQSFAQSNSSALTSDPQGLWLLVGDSQGQVSVYNSANAKTEFSLSSQGVLHQGEVTALCFAAHELNFYSAGQDRKLLYTHARGTLQAVDKGRNSNHSATISILLRGKERLFSGALDKSIKAWAYSGGQPVTYKEQLNDIVALSLGQHQDRTVLFAADSNNRIHLIELSPEEKFKEAQLVLADGYALAKNLSQSEDPKEHEKAVDLLAAFDDAAALQQLAQILKNSRDKSLRERIVAALAQSKHPQANQHLSNLLRAPKQAIGRAPAFQALLSRVDADDFSPHSIALDTGHEDVGRLAIQDLTPRAAQQAQAEQLLTTALYHSRAAIRLLALNTLEQVYAPHSPQASLLALQDHAPDLQRAALIRLFQRDLLAHSEVQRAILLAQSADDADLRHTAFLVAILSRPALSAALKSREADLARQLQELEDFELLGTPANTSSKLTKAAKTALKRLTKKQAATQLSALEDADYAILLQGMSNPYADISFTAALALAALQDQRAFGLLLLLSQEDKSSIRAGVCRAFAHLQQSDSLPTLRLLLDDEEAPVRDAAFNALQSLQPNPLTLVEQGLQTQYEDIHARSLKLLLDNVAQQSPPQPAALKLLSKALDDPFEAIRQETYKACLKQQLGGSEADTLRLLLNGHFINIHQEVLYELQAKSKVLPALDWVQPLLFELFNSRFETVRQAAFTFALQEPKRFANLDVLAAATQSAHLDIRRAVLKHIEQQPSLAKQAFVQTLVQDDVKSLRRQALPLLLDANKRDALHAALDSPYEDVQVAVAARLAYWGDERVYAVLTRLLEKPEPHDKLDWQHWQGISEQALHGLATLGDARSLSLLEPFLAHQDKTLAQAAASALAWVGRSEHRAQLLHWQQDERAPIRANASFALALLGDERGELLFQDSHLLQQLQPTQQLAARIRLYGATPVTLQSHLHSETFVSALLVLAFYELYEHGDAPYLSPWALSIEHAELQQVFAALMTRYSQPQACWDYLADYLATIHNKANNSQTPPWQISRATLQQMAAVLVHGSGQVAARLLESMACLNQLSPLSTWELHYSAFQQGHATAIAAAEQAAAQHPPALPDPNQQTAWNQRVFGAYLGLIRQSQAPDRRLKALRSLCQLAQQDESLSSSMMSSLLSLLNHRQTTIRQYALEQLQHLGMDTVPLSQAALASPHSDIVRQGLQLQLAANPDASMSLLQDLVTGHNALLAQEAYEVALAQFGAVAIAPAALQARFVPLRSNCIYALGTLADDPQAQALLLQAIDNDDESSPVIATRILAKQGHPQLLKAVMQRLHHSDDEYLQQRLLQHIRLLNDPAVAQAVYDYMQQKTLSSNLRQVAYETLCRYRFTALFNPLLQQLEQQEHDRQALYEALLAITGYDQPIHDYAEQQANQRWLNTQYPRHDDLLIQLFRALLRLNLHKQAKNLLHSLAWAQDEQVDLALQEALPMLDSQYLPQLIEALSYRLEKRSGRATALLELLSHKDNELQFLAALALAKNGYTQGFSILLAAVDYHSDADARQQAVLALGQSGDERALDKLLKLAEDKEHFLSQAAVEALGHMGQSEYAERILKLLTQNLKQADPYSELVTHALNGLRYFNTLAAWQAIQHYIQTDPHAYSYINQRPHAISLLRYHDTPATQQLLLQLVRSDEDFSAVHVAYNTLQHLLTGDDKHTNEADYALIQGHHIDSVDAQALQRITDYAPTADILKLLQADYSAQTAQQSDAILERLAQALIMRDDYDIAALSDLLSLPKAIVVDIAARLLGHQDKLPENIQTALQQVLDTWYPRWQQLQQNDAETAPQALQTVQQLLWTLTRHQLTSEHWLTLISTRQKAERPLQSQILDALLSVAAPLKPAIIQAIEPLQQDPLATVSHRATQILHRQQATSTATWQAFLTQADTLLSDTQFTPALQQAATQAAHQAQVLPLLIAQQDVDTLQSIASDTQQQEAQRLGAIEALAHILTPEASKALHILRQTQDSDMARAAYRALRRQQRSQQQAAAKAPNAGVAL